MDEYDHNLKLAQEFIAARGGSLPEFKYNIIVPGVGKMFILPENEQITKYWVLSTEIYRHTGWDSPGCLLRAIEALPEGESDLMPIALSDGEIAQIHVVNQDGMMPLLLNNVGHFENGLAFLANSWSYIFSQKKDDYKRVPEPLRTSLQFWDIVESEDSSRAIAIQTLMDSFQVGEEEIRAVLDTQLDRVWDEAREAWVYKKK